MSRIIGKFTVTAGTQLESVLPEATYAHQHVIVLIKECTADMQLTDPEGADVTFPLKTAGGADFPAGAWQLGWLRTCSLEGGGPVTFTLVEANPEAS